MLRVNHLSKRFFSAAAASTTEKTAPKSTNKYFDKILIANRGEISCRVSRTAHKMGIKTVAIYSDPDIHSLHVREADEAVCVGPAPSSKSYLNAGRILKAIQQTGAQAVHPGYGFLSENAAFAKVLEDRNIKWLGPPSTAIEAMGDKVESKLLAKKAGVNTIPGYMGIVADAEEAIKIAREIGYPVMIKASGGGGGKGMRIAWNDDEVRLGYRLSKQEAKSSFNDDRLFVEKFIEDPRHIEIQLIADSHGNVAALPERECSIQRRNQKVIEESPSLLLDEKTRRAMQDQACQLALAVGYQSAGTVEFLADKNRNFYFLEMNTRLQVEHPVTEMVTGLDLVELMIRVGAGEKLPSHLIGTRVPILGHAFESRVYAEDPFRGFLPSTGRLYAYEEPQTHADRDPYMAGEGIRADTGIVEGSEISMFYDPMICKLVTHADTRDAALDRMRAALDNYVIRGVTHNVPLLRDLYDMPRFREGRITTQLIREEYPDGFKGVTLPKEARLHVPAVGAIMFAIRELATADISGRMDNAKVPDVEDVIVTLGEDIVTGQTFRVNVKVVPVHKDTTTSHNHHHHNSNEHEELHFHENQEVEWVVTMAPMGKNILATSPVTMRLRGVDWAPESPILFAQLKEGPVAADRKNWVSSSTLRVQHLQRIHGGFRLQYQGAIEDVHVRSPRNYELSSHMKPKTKRDLSKVVVSPMPGTLISLAVKAGDSIEIGQELAVVEAMKMQNVLRSPRRGTIKSVLQKPGATLHVDQVIIEFSD